MPPIRTLHVDIEGGWGGSSRSLFELLSRVDPSRIRPLIVHRENGPVVERYAAIGLATRHVPEIASYVPREPGWLVDLVHRIPRLARLTTAANEIAKIANSHGAQLIHLNYDGLIFLAPLLRRKLDMPVVVHCRASDLARNRAGRVLAALLERHADHLFFISPNEEAWFRAMRPNARLSTEVLWNIAPRPLVRRPIGADPEAVYLGNLDPGKGVDRMLDIAEALDRLGAPPLRLSIYGMPRGRAGYEHKLSAEIERRGLDRRVKLCGYASRPEHVLAGAFALIRPSRRNDPWGRDVIEAITAGTPVLATGTFSGVVRPGVTGWLFDPFDPSAVATRLVEMASNPQLWTRLSDTCLAVGADEFGGQRQVPRVMDLFETLVAARAGVVATTLERRKELA